MMCFSADGGLLLHGFDCSVLQHGIHDLRVWPDVEADGSPGSETLGLPETSAATGEMAKLSVVSQCVMVRLKCVESS